MMGWPEIRTPPAQMRGGVSLSQVDDVEFRRACPVLAASPLPVRWEVPDYVRSDQNFLLAVRSVGPQIEKAFRLLAKQGDNHYVMGFEIRGTVLSENPDNTYSINYDWSSYTILTTYDDYPYVVDLYGHVYLPITPFLRTPGDA